MADQSMSTSRLAAAACWLGAPLTGGLMPAAILLLTWPYRGSLARRNALAATIVWAALVVVYVPTVVFGWIVPSFESGEPASWGITILLVLAAIAVIATLGGVLGVLVSSRGSRHP